MTSTLTNTMNARLVSAQQRKKPPRNFGELLRARAAAGFAVSVGLDPDITREGDKLPWNDPDCPSSAHAVFDFCCNIVDKTAKYTLCFKPNWSFFLELEDEDGELVGLQVLQNVIRYINIVAPDVPVIVDCKVGDIGNTNKPLTRTLFGKLGADAITVHNYMGLVAGMEQFLEDPNKGVIVLCRTSNSGGAEFQDFTGSVYEYAGYPGVFASERHVRVELAEGDEFDPGKFTKLDGEYAMYEYVAMRVARNWNVNHNCYLVVGATATDELSRVRELVGPEDDHDFFVDYFLMPGLGVQGAEESEVVEAAVDSFGHGMMVHSSRGIIYADNPADKVREVHTKLASYRMLAVLQQNDCVLTDTHVVLSGSTDGERDHSTGYINLRPMLGETWFMNWVGRDLAAAVSDRWRGFDFVVGPETLGRDIAREVAREMQLPALYCDVKDGDEGFKVASFNPKLQLERFVVEDGRALIVDDLFTKGSTLLAVVALLRSMGISDQDMVIATVVRRGNELVPGLESVLDIMALVDGVDFEKFTAANCRATGPCHGQVPMRRMPGHGAEFLDANPVYPEHVV